MDDECTEYILHLQRLAAGTADPDVALTDAFSQSLFYHTPDIFQGDHECSPALQDILLLLFRVVRFSPQEYTDLLEKILRNLRLKQIFLHISEDVVLQNINETFLAVLEAKMKSGERSDVVTFVERKRVAELLRHVLFDPRTTPALALKIVTFLKRYYLSCSVPDPAVVWRDWISLADFSADKVAFSSSSALFSYIELLLVFQACNLDHEYMERALDVDVKRALEDDLVVVVLVDFLALYIPGKKLAGNLQRLVQALLDNRSNDSLVLHAYNTLEAALVRNGLHIVHNPPTVHLSLDGAREFCQLDLAVFSNPEEVFSSFSGKSIESVSEPIFFAMLHLLSDRRFFELLVRSGNLRESRLQLLPKDLLFEAMWRLLAYEYGAQYLFSQLSGLLPGLLSAEKEPNVEILRLRRAILRRLAASRVDMGVYADAVLRAARTV